MEEMKSLESKCAALIVCVENGMVQQFPLKDKTTIGNGVWAHTTDIEIKADGIGDLQGKIVKNSSGYEYQDMSKGKKTYYNSKLLGSADLDYSKNVLLKDGDVLRIMGESDFGPKKCQVSMVFYHLYSPDYQWESVDLTDTDKQLQISRSEEMEKGTEIRYSDQDAKPAHYAVLSYQEGWKIEDHNTRLGVFLNSIKIQKPEVLKNMDAVRIGNTLFFYVDGKLYYNHHEMAANSLEIHIEERSVWNLFRKKTLLKDINMKIYPGEMVLILGGSGAGKTTFINAVMGYEKAKGEILEGNVDVYKNYSRMKYEIGFVPQQDLLRMEDEVYETLENAAELKLSVSMPKEDKKAKIKEVLGLFGLLEDEHSLVRKLSGGQRKRLSIAVEYIGNPSLFFLDEPDSGLDGIMARSLMENLRMIADQKKIVLVITHSPDRVADLFNKVIVLAKSAETNTGNLAFYGGLDEAREFFGADTMEGIVRKINRKDEGGDGLADEFIRKYQETDKK